MYEAEEEDTKSQSYKFQKYLWKKNDILATRPFSFDLNMCDCADLSYFYFLS